MRKTLVLGIIAIFWSTLLLAGPVTRTQAEEAARAFLEGRGYTELLSMEVVQEMKTVEGTTSMYVINLKPEGWILVSADDVIQPVLAYSFEQAYDVSVGWKDAAAYLVDGYSQQIDAFLKEEPTGIHEGWTRLGEAVVSKSTAAGNIEPFIDVTWNQGSGWNRFCPEDADGPGGHVYVGCVAVSMAQAMSVYEYPVKGKGISSYVHETYGSLAVNFDLQDPYEWDMMSHTSSDDYNAKLLYDCAVTVEMNFSPNGSGAFVRKAASVMIQHFTYSQSMSFVEREDHEQDWENMLVAELEAGRPVIYRGEPGDGNAGHAWNVDGYGDGYFHMNFGWSGSGNGYYSLESITPGGSDFTSRQGAVIGIKPPVSGPYDMNLSETSVDEKLPVGSFVAEVLVEDEDPDNVYTYTCFGDWDPIMENWKDPAFYVENDTLWTAEEFVYNATNPAANSIFVRIKVQDIYGTSFQDNFDIEVLKVFEGPASLALSDSSIMEDMPAGTAVAKLLIEDDDPDNTYTYTLKGPLNPGTNEHEPASFYVDGDSLRSSEIFDHEEADSCYVLIEIEDRHGNVFTSVFMIEIEESGSGSTGVFVAELDAGMIYPNPADSQVWIRQEGWDELSAEILELATGRSLISVSQVQDRIDVSQLPDGLYVLILRSTEGVQAGKLLIRH